jgi:uncharacterized protein (DUF2384 family)
VENEEKPVQPARSKVRWSAITKLAPDAAMRQGRVTKLAFEALGGRDAAIAYLNTPCGTLGGRPLDLAVGSADGLCRVERELTDLKREA